MAQNPHKGLDLIRDSKMSDPAGRVMGSIRILLQVGNVLIDTFAKESAITSKSSMRSVLAEGGALKKGILNIIHNIGRDLKR